MASSSEGCAKAACFGPSPHVLIFTELRYNPTSMQYLWAFGVAVWHASGHSLEMESARSFLLSKTAELIVLEKSGDPSRSCEEIDELVS
jgi:hypothetical protein